MKQNLFNKLWLRVGMIVAIMTTALSGTVWADGVVVYTLTPASGSNNNYASNCDIVIDGVTWNLTGNSTTNPWRIGGKSISNTNRAVYSKTAITDNVSKIEVTHGAASSITVNSWTVIVSKNSDFSNPVSTLTPTFAASSTTTVNRPDGVDWSNCYYKFVYNVTVSGNSNKFVEFTQAKFYNETGTVLTESDLSLSPTSLSFDLYNDNSAKTITCTTSSTGAITVSGGTGYVTTSVEGKIITVTPVAATSEAQTITVSQAADDTYAAGSASFTVSITNSAPDYTTLPFSWEGGASSALLAKAGVTANGLGSDYASGNTPYLVKFDNTDDYIQVKTDSQPGKVTIGVKMIGGATASSITVQESADGETFTNVETLAISGSQNDVLTLETTNDFAATTRYVRLSFTKGSNVGVGPISIALPSNDPVINAENSSINYNTTSGSINYEIVHPVEGGTISASTDAAWLTFGSTGTAYTAEENTNISARVANVTLTYTYNTSQTVTKEITLTQGGDPNAPGTENNPYTVAEARAAIDAGTGVTGVYATGIVSEIVEAYSSQYHNISYNISADGLTTSDQLEIYRGKSFNGDNFTSENDIQVGDEVVVYGDLTTHGEIYEFAQNSRLVSLTRAKQDPTIPSTPVSVAYGSTHTVTGIVAGEATLTSSNTAVATVEGLVITPVAVGTTTITVTTEENTYYNAGSETFELTVTAPAGQTTAPTGSAGGTIFEETFADCTGTNNDFGTSTTSDGNGDFTADSDNVWTTENAHGANGSAKFGASKSSGSATTPSITATVGTTYTLTFKAAPWGSESATMNVSVDGGTISGISEDAMSTGQWNDFTASITATATSFTVTFAASKNRFFLDEVKVVAPATPAPAITATLNGSGYATFCSQYPLDFSDYETADYSAWQITGVSGETITFSQITGSVMGGTGILLKGTAGETIELSSVGSTNTLSGNKLYGTLAPTYVAADEYYGLSGQSFVKVNAGTVSAGRALLPASALGSNPVKAFTFVFEEDDATAIEMVNGQSSMVNGPIYNLAGQRISKMQKGINIVNGKKILK